MEEDVRHLEQTARGEEFLEHFGVKGMRWGVRNSVASTPSSPKMSKTRDTKGNLLTKDDAKWNKKVTNVRKGMSAYNKTADTMNAVVIPKINNDPKYKNVDFTNPKNSKIQAKYHAEYKAAFEKEFNKNLRAAYGNSPSGKYKVRLSSDSEPGLWTVDYNELQHAEGDFSFSIVVKKNSLGHITAFEVKDDRLIQSDISEFDLAHFGVKGMRWGVRRSRAELDSGIDPVPVTVTTRDGSSKIATAGGQRQPPSDDAKRAAAISQKLKKSGVNSLSNKEMQDLVNRLNLEQQISRVGPQTKSTQKKAVINFLSRNGSQALNQITKNAINLAIKAMFDQAMNQKKK